MPPAEYEAAVRGHPVTPAERRLIRGLYRNGLRVVDIAKRTGFSEKTITRACAGLRRKRLRRQRSPQLDVRDAAICWFVLAEGHSMAEVGRRLSLTTTAIWQIVERARRRQGRRAEQDKARDRALRLVLGSRT